MLSYSASWCRSSSGPSTWPPRVAAWAPPRPPRAPTKHPVPAQRRRPARVRQGLSCRWSLGPFSVADTWHESREIVANGPCKSNINVNSLRNMRIRLFHQKMYNQSGAAGTRGTVLRAQLSHYTTTAHTSTFIKLRRSFKRACPATRSAQTLGHLLALLRVG